MLSMMEQEKKLPLLSHYFLYVVCDGVTDKTHSVIALFFLCCLWWSKRKNSFCSNVIFCMFSMMGQEKKLTLLWHYFFMLSIVEQEKKFILLQHYFSHVVSDEETEKMCFVTTLFLVCFFWQSKRKTSFIYNVIFFCCLWWSNRKKSSPYHIIFSMLSMMKEEKNPILLKRYFFYVLYDGAR